MGQTNCALCGGTENKRCFRAWDFDASAEPFEITECTRCGLAMTSPVPDPIEMDRYYQQAYYGAGKKKFSAVIELLTVVGNKLRARKILKELSRTQSSGSTTRVLDIGCGRANLLSCLRDAGCECYGTERAKFPDDGYTDGTDIFKGSLAERAYEDGFFDAVVVWHVLEHLHEPFVTLDEIARITQKDGIVAIAVPNFSSLQSSWFKSDWFHLDLPRHLYHFSPDNLCQALVQRGYTITSVSTSSLEQNIFGFIQSAMNKLKFIGRPNEFYQLLKKRSGIVQMLKLVVWLIIAIIILPFAMTEFVISFILGRGASAIVFAHKT